MLVLLVVAGMAILAFLLTRLFEGSGETALLVWISGCSLSLALPLLAVILAVRTFRGIASPLGDVTAAEATTSRKSSRFQQLRTPRDICTDRAD